MAKNKLLSIYILVALILCGCSKDPTGEPPPTPPTNNNPDLAAIEKMDTYLKSKYLWNDDYKKLSPDFTLAYDEFLSKTLMKMTTNTLDKKPNGKGGYHLYSYIERKAKAKSSGRVSNAPDNGAKKELVQSFGIISMVYTTMAGTNDVALVVEGVYPDSPAATAGIRRGTVISKYNNNSITENTVQNVWRDICASPISGDVSLYDLIDKKTHTITSTQIYENPVLATKIMTDNGKNIGLLVYSGFDAAYDGELLSAIKLLHDAGVKDVILDLRLNGGGHVISANLIASCIAGTSCSNKKFEYYRYNKSRMDNHYAERTPYDVSAKMFYDNFKYPTYYNVDLTDYALNLNRLYCITSNNTASASELTINSLRGIDFPVTLIGDKTNGKNVGMEVYEFDQDSYSYTFAPITFQSYNAKQFTDYASGMEVDYSVDDWVNGFKDFAEQDPCIAKAMSLITGKPIAAGKSRSSAQLTVSPKSFTQTYRLQGMIK